MTIYGSLIGLVFLIVSCGNDGSSNNQSKDNGPYPQITTDVKALQHVLRLRMQYLNGQFSVIDHRIMVANPTPVIQVANSAPLLVQTLSRNGKVLFAGGIHDPRFAELDIEDTNRPEIWRHKDIALNEAIFPLKIPIENELGELRIIDNRSGKQLFRVNLIPFMEGNE